MVDMKKELEETQTDAFEEIVQLGEELSSCVADKEYVLPG